MRRRKQKQSHVGLFTDLHVEISAAEEDRVDRHVIIRRHTVVYAAVFAFLRPGKHRHSAQIQKCLYSFTTYMNVFIYLFICLFIFLANNS